MAITNINTDENIGHSSYQFSIKDVSLLQDRLKEHGISDAFRHMMAFDGFNIESVEELLNVWLPFAERMVKGEDVVKGFETAQNFIKKELLK